MTIAHTSTCFFGSVFGGFGIWAAGCGRGCLDIRKRTDVKNTLPAHAGACLSPKGELAQEHERIRRV